MNGIWVVLTAGLIGVVAECGAAGVQEWLNAANVPRDVTGGQVREFLVQRIPSLTVPASKDAWNGYARKLRQEYLDTVVLQGVPESWLAYETAPVWGDTIDRGTYRIRKLRYQALSGLWIPALLYEPVGEVKDVPAILNVNGHTQVGKANEEEQVRCINLAMRGMLALHPEWYSFGELDNPEYGHGNLAYLDLVGVRGVSLFYLALKRSLDILAMDPRTDPDRIAMTGLSGGGWQTAFFSALDDRVDLIVPVAGHASMNSRVDHSRDIGDLEQAPSDMLTVADYTHLTALFAPRPALLIYNAEDECCFGPEHTLPALYDVVKPVYTLLEHGDRFESYINHDPGTHNYALDNRQQFYHFLNKHFLPPEQRIDEELPWDGELLTLDDLRVGIPEDNPTFVTLAKARLAENRRPLIPERSEASFDPWRQEQRAALEKIAKPVAMRFGVEKQSESEEGGVQATTYWLTSGDWTIPALHLIPEGGGNESITVVLGDEGIAALAEVIDGLLAEKEQVVAIEPLFIGGTQPLESQSERLAMMINATGDKVIGIQAGQIAAACQWAREAAEVNEVQLYAKGCNAGLAALIAACTFETGITKIQLEDMPESLASLIDDGISYNKFPAVFCYGLLAAFDVPELIALSAPATVERL